MHRVTLPLVILLASCSSSEQDRASKREATPLMSQNMEQRFAASRKRMADPNDRSRFDPGVQSTLARNKGSGSRITSQSYKPGAFKGSKSYSVTPGHKTTDYSGKDKRSGMSGQSFARRDQVASESDAAFAAGESRLASKTARQAGQTFRDAGDTFGTSANRDVLRSQEKNNRPVFIELEENRRNPAYSEEQVRRLLGR
ncbi:MAG TPA: hypothetical protein DIT64_07875 [Verrucomicrobiales bacterium]|nr:hypothetical protein [Verrucomicrobiales bacterium]